MIRFLFLQLSLVASAAVAGTLGDSLPVPEEWIIRYGPWGVVTVLLILNGWLVRRLVDTLGVRMGAQERCMIALVQILSERPCLYHHPVMQKIRHELLHPDAPSGEAERPKAEGGGPIE
jgi:hypothetical protein